MSGEIDQREESTQEIMPSFDFLLEEKSEKNSLLAEHRTWLKSIKRERPLPKKHYRVAVYICAVPCKSGGTLYCCSRFR